jgi:hypothetical protein
MTFLIRENENIPLFYSSDFILKSVFHLGLNIRESYGVGMYYIFFENWIPVVPSPFTEQCLLVRSDIQLSAS